MHLRNLAALALCAAACNDDDAAGPTPRGAEVAATAQIRFAPDSVTIEQGGAVTWNFGAVPHNVVFNAVAGRPQDIAGQNVNVAVRRTFAQVGTFAYVCTIHPGMAASVTVSVKPNTPGYLVSP